MDRSVAILSDRFGPGVGGHARVAYELARAVERLGWRVRVVCNDAPPAEYSFQKIIVPRLPGTPLLTAYRAGIEATKLEDEVDLYHSNGAFGFSYLFRKHRHPFIAHMHSSTPRLFRATLQDPLFAFDVSSLESLLGMIPAWVVEASTLSRADLVLANSRETAQAIEGNYRLRNNVIRVLNNGCTESNTVPTESQTGSSPGSRAFRLLTVCRLTYTKGLDFVLQAMQSVCQSRRNVELIIVGEGPLRPALEVMISRLGLGGRVRMVGHCEGEKLDKIYASADLFVYGANPGLTLLEAMSHGLPFVLKVDNESNPAGVHLQLLRDSKLGMITEENDPKTFAKLILSAADDFLWRREQASAVRAVAMTLLNWDQIARTLVGYYESIIPGQSSSFEVSAE